MPAQNALSPLERRLGDVHAEVGLRDTPHRPLELVLEPAARPSEPQADPLPEARGVEGEVDGEGDEDEAEVADVLAQSLGPRERGVSGQRSGCPVAREAYPVDR